MICNLFLVSLIWKWRMKQKTQDPRVVVLVSTGDNSPSYGEYANSIASDLKQTGNFRDVFFSGWKLLKEDEDVEQMRTAIERSDLVVLFSSPYGIKSYSEFLEKKEKSVWRDAFVLGVYILLKEDRIRKIPKIYIVYLSDLKDKISDHVPSEWMKKSAHCFNLQSSDEYNSLYVALSER